MAARAESAPAVAIEETRSVAITVEETFDERVEIGNRGHHFEPDRTGAGNDARVVERVDEDQSLGRLHLARLGISVVIHWPVQDHSGAVLLGLGDFHRRRALGHDDSDRNAEPLAVIGDGLRVIAGRRRDDAALPLVLGKLQ